MFTIYQLVQDFAPIHSIFTDRVLISSLWQQLVHVGDRFCSWVMVMAPSFSQSSTFSPMLVKDSPSASCFSAAKMFCTWQPGRSPLKTKAAAGVSCIEKFTDKNRYYTQLKGALISADSIPMISHEFKALPVPTRLDSVPIGCISI